MSKKVIIFGPWVGEFSYELSWWNPECRKVKNDNFKDYYAVHLGFNGRKVMYSDFIDEYIPHPTELEETLQFPATYGEHINGQDIIPKSFMEHLNEVVNDFKKRGFTEISVHKPKDIPITRERCLEDYPYGDYVHYTVDDDIQRDVVSRINNYFNNESPTIFLMARTRTRHGNRCYLDWNPDNWPVFTKRLIEELGVNIISLSIKTQGSRGGSKGLAGHELFTDLQHKIMNFELEKDDSDSLPIYMIDGVVEADGRFTSQANTILIQEIELSSFEGIGTFEGTGTFNGTGQFTGIGEFSGELVKPGSFYQTGLVPGDYEVFAQLDNGREVKLPQIISVGLNPSYDIEMTIPGSVLRGNITDIEGNVMDNITFEWNDLLLDNGFSEILTNSTGGYNFGPISTGEYQVRIDLDNDTFFEINQTISVGNVSSTLSPISVIPDMYDLTVQLTSPVNDSNGEDLLSLDNRSLDLASELGTLVTVHSDENGVIEAELLPGKYSLFDSNSEEFLLFESFELVDEDLSITMDYSISSTVSGQLMVYTADFDQNWTTEEAENNSTAASNVNIVFSSGDLMYSIERPIKPVVLKVSFCGINASHGRFFISKESESLSSPCQDPEDRR